MLVSGSGVRRQLWGWGPLAKGTKMCQVLCTAAGSGKCFHSICYLLLLNTINNQDCHRCYLLSSPLLHVGVGLWELP